MQLTPPVVGEVNTEITKRLAQFDEHEELLKFLPFAANLKYLRAAWSAFSLPDWASASLPLSTLILTHLNPHPACSYFRGRIRWEAAGHIGASCWASAMPIASFTPASLRHSGGNRQRLAANVLLAVLVVARAAALLRRLLRKLRAQQRSVAGTAGGSSAPSAVASRAASFLRSLSLRRRQPAAPQQQAARAAPPSLLAVAVADRLLLLDLVTAALMMLALVLLSTSLAVRTLGAAWQGSHNRMRLQPCSTPGCAAAH